jgi:hypothetical protein
MTPSLRFEEEESEESRGARRNAAPELFNRRTKNGQVRKRARRNRSNEVAKRGMHQRRNKRVAW